MADTSAVWSDSVKLGADDLMGHMYVYILEIFWQSSRSGSISARTTTRSEPLFVRKLVPKNSKYRRKKAEKWSFFTTANLRGKEVRWPCLSFVISIQVEELYTMVLVACLDLINSWHCESCKYMLRVTLQKSCLDSFLIISVNSEARATSQKEQGKRQVYLYGSI